MAPKLRQRVRLVSDKSSHVTGVCQEIIYQQLHHNICQPVINVSDANLTSQRWCTQRQGGSMHAVSYMIVSAAIVDAPRIYIEIWAKHYGIELLTWKNCGK